MAKPRDTEPPQPPPFQRKIIISRGQAIGVGMLAAIVVAALVGLLGQRSGEAQASGAGLEVRVSYPKILRYKTSLPLEISVRNASSATMGRIELRIARGYLDAFEDVRFTPDVREIGERHYTVSLAALPAGESRTVVAWLEAQERGNRPGHLQVAAEGRAAIDLDWSTLVLP